MRERRFGRIVNITSTMVKSPRPHMALSSTARTGLTAFSKAMSPDAAADNVTINNLLPERIDTPRQQFMAQRMMKAQGIDMAEARRRSVQTGFISGQNLQLDRGSYAGLLSMTSFIRRKQLPDLIDHQHGNFIMARPVIITCAVTGGAPTTGMSPHVPITPEQIANESLAAAKAGAAIVHLHVRDLKTAEESMELQHYREVVDRIRSVNSEVLINLTTGPGGFYVPSKDSPAQRSAESSLTHPEIRVRHVVELKPDLCSLDVATMNHGERVFMNTADHLRRMAKLIGEAGVKIEIEVFDLGHVRLARDLIEKGHLSSPPMFQLCLGIPWGAAATPESLMFLRDQLPADATWAAFGISRFEFPIAAAAVVMGGHVRVGLEDNLFLEHGKLAPGNASLVQRAVQIIEAIGETPATPAEARKILRL